MLDVTRIQKLAGIQPLQEQQSTYEELMEVVQLPDDLSIDDLVRRLDACRRALSIVNTLPDPADRRKWLSVTFSNLNKVRSALKRVIEREGITGMDHNTGGRFVSQPQHPTA